MQDVTKLPRWGDDKPSQEPGETPKGVRFPFKPEFNKRIAFSGVDLALKTTCDVIVVGTNDQLDADGCIHQVIVDTLGTEFAKSTENLAPLKVTDCRILPVPEEKIGARNVMVTMPPRYTQKYLSAAINSLNKTYLNSLQACVDNGYRTVMFTAVQDYDHRYNSDVAAEVVIRTIRRFFEHYPTNVDLICLCLDNHDTIEYMKQMRLYFPRSNEEAVEAEKSLPKDVGNEWGEMVVESRSIRISTLPGMGGDDDEYSDEEDQIPDVVGEKPKEEMEYSVKQPSPDVRNTEGVNDPTSPNYIPPGYVNGILNRANTLDLSPLEKARFFYDCATDSLSKRRVLVFIGQNMVQPSVPRDMIMPYMAKILDSISFNPFTIVYVHCTATNNAESMFWIHSIASTFPRRCLCNMRLAVLYPTFWVKTHLRINRLGGLRPVEDISYYDNLGALFRVIGRDAVRLPEEITRADLSVSSVSSSPSKSTGSSSQSTAAAASEDDNL